MEKGKKKVILYVLGWPLGQGGHIASTLSFVIGAYRAGYGVIVFAPDGPKRPAYEASCDLFVVARGGFLRQFFQLCQIMLTNKVDVILAADYVAMLRVAGLRLFWTVRTIFVKAGGPLPSYRLPPAERIVVFSRELQDGLAASEPAAVPKIFLLKERIDNEFFSVERPASGRSKAEVVRMFMAMRLVKAKRHWLDNVMEETLAVNQAGPVRFHLTIAGGGELEGVIRDRSVAINNALGWEAVSLVGELVSPVDIRTWYYASSLVVGHGRGILEAMSCGRPVIVLAASGGGAEWVSPRNVDMVESYNFSGRHIKSPSSRMRDLLLDHQGPDLDFLATWSRRYVEKEYAASKGWEKMAALYAENAPFSSRWSFLEWLKSRRR